ncbi:MAG: 16S rRNA (uracil(1498)-N(3))-methyltransferase [Spirochaetota bacterium]
MSAATTPLRSLQREHALLLLSQDEFRSLLDRGEVPLPARHLEHFSKVMRRRTAWQAFAGDGHGAIAVCEVRKDTVVLGTENLRQAERTSAPVTLVQAWPKPKALSLILQKAAELGVSEIALVTTEHAAHPAEKAERMEAILENACMQAYNPFKPALSLRALSDDALYAGSRNFFGDIEGAEKLRNLKPTAPQRVTFVNGPEGGFSAREVDWLRSRATGILLSENVLRSETAAIIALGHFCQSP